MKLYDMWREGRPFGLTVPYGKAQAIKHSYQDTYPNHKYYLRVWSHREVKTNYPDAYAEGKLPR